MPPQFLGYEPSHGVETKQRRKKNQIIFAEGYEEIRGPFCISWTKEKRGECKVPNFTDRKVDRAYENFMKQIPGFRRDPPEAKVIQKDLEKNAKKGALKNDIPK